MLQQNTKVRLTYPTALYFSHFWRLASPTSRHWKTQVTGRFGVLWGINPIGSLHLPAVSSHNSSSKSALWHLFYKDTNSIHEARTSQQLHLQIPSHWGLGFNYEIWARSEGPKHSDGSHSLLNLLAITSQASLWSFSFHCSLSGCIFPSFVITSLPEFIFILPMPGLPRRLSGKDPPASAGDTGSIPGRGRSSGDRHGNPLQYSCLGNSTDRGG